MVMGPTGPETKVDSAGEGHQQFTRSDQLEDQITEPFPSIDRLRVAFLIALFELSGVMLRVTYMFGIVTAVSSGSSIPAFRSCGGDKQTHVCTMFTKRLMLVTM
jgi:hypothetical protein